MKLTEKKGAALVGGAICDDEIRADTSLITAVKLLLNASL